MNSYVTDEFIALYRRLPLSIRQQARRAYQLFRRDPGHPGLRFKKVHPRRPIYSARVSGDYRVIGLIEAGNIHWFWIGSHAEYDYLLNQL